MASPAHDDDSSRDRDLGTLFGELERKLANGGRRPGLRAWMECAESWRILEALRQCRGNRSAAARALGIGRRTLYTKMEKLGIEPSWGPRREAGPLARPTRSS
jgi:DNA-binding NtrC family response regulator